MRKHALFWQMTLGLKSTSTIEIGAPDGGTTFNHVMILGTDDRDKGARALGDQAGGD